MSSLNLGKFFYWSRSQNIMHQLSYYYKSKKEFYQYYFRLKQESCPSCNHCGCLILHGYLPKAYNGKGSEKLSRGRRIFCSNRNRRTGCGHTFSIIMNYVLKKHILNSKNLWLFLLNILQGMTKKEAFLKLKLPFTLSMAYRLWSKFILNQVRLRTLLYQKRYKPKNDSLTSPILETILHIKNYFPKKNNPIAEFQAVFQQPFLV